MGLAAGIAADGMGLLLKLLLGLLTLHHFALYIFLQQNL